MATIIHPKSQLKSQSWYRFTHFLSVFMIYFALLIFIILALYPMLTMLMNSFKSDNEMYRNPVALPIVWTLKSYAAIFEYHGGMWLNFINSAIVAVTSTLFSVILCALAAFAFAKYRFKGRSLIFALLLGTMMVPSEVTMPGLFIAFAQLKWINTLQAQILPTITSVSGLFLIRQYMLEIPDALLDAARIDGANHLQVFWYVMVPTSAPVLGAYAILHFLGVWNAYTWPTLVATKRAVQPIMVVLPQIVDPVIGFVPAWGTIMAGCVLSTLPLLIVFLAFQEQFLSSVTIGAVKE